MTYSTVGDIFYPVNFKGRMYTMDKEGEKGNEEIFGAVMNGYKIDMSDAIREDGKSRFVDI